MRLLKKNNLLSLFFIFFFVFQEFWSYSVNSLEVHKQYWIVVLSLLAVISIYLLVNAGIKYRLPLLYTVILSFGAIATTINGYSIGFCLLKVLFAIVSFSSLVFVTKHKINLRFFELLLIGAYIYYYFMYFGNLQYVENKDAYDGDVFGHSSSNTISICLNCILFLYFILNKYYKEKNGIRILVYSIINMLLIIIQESRAGVVVGLLLIVIIIYDMFGATSRIIKTFLVVLILVFSAVVVLNFFVITNYLSNIGLRSDSYENNVRFYAQTSFFQNMDSQSFLFGYGRGQLFAGLDRTFNSYLDLWNRYGFFSFCFFIVLAIRRIKMNKKYAIPIIYYSPIIVYAFVETLFAGTLWDMFFIYMLFLSDPNLQQTSNKKLLIQDQRSQ